MQTVTGNLILTNVWHTLLKEVREKRLTVTLGKSGDYEIKDKKKYIEAL